MPAAPVKQARPVKRPKSACTARSMSCSWQADTRVPPPIRVQLPVGGWQVGFRVHLDGRTAVEVTDAGGVLTGLVVSGQLPILSIDAAWSGFTRDPGVDSQWWALAIGHTPASAPPPTVTFTCGAEEGIPCPTAVPPDVVDRLWVAHDGLWVAAATGRYTQVRLVACSATRERRLTCQNGSAPHRYPGRP